MRAPRHQFDDAIRLDDLELHPLVVEILDVVRTETANFERRHIPDVSATVLQVHILLGFQAILEGLIPTIDVQSIIVRSQKCAAGPMDVGVGQREGGNCAEPADGPQSRPEEDTQGRARAERQPVSDAQSRQYAARQADAERATDDEEHQLPRFIAQGVVLSLGCQSVRIDPV